MKDILENVKYVFDKNNKKIAVQIDIDTFEAVESIIEDYGLAQAMNEVSNGETIDLDKMIETLKKVS